MNTLLVKSSPHIHSGSSISEVMGDVLLALLPASGAAIYFYGYYAGAIILVAVLSAVLTEYLWQKIVRRENTIGDLSALVSGLLLALTLPPRISLFLVFLGAVFTILFGKCIFGGLGYNPFNPALVGRAFLQISWPRAMGSWFLPQAGQLTITSATTTATPLMIDKGEAVGQLPDLGNMFLGNRAGSLGETAALALLLGGLYLLIRRQITLTIPLSYIFTVALVSWLFGKNPLFHILAGGLLLGAIFMATDPVTSPVTEKGRLVFGVGCGILTVLIRLKGGFPEGVCFSILIMNALVPLIDRMTLKKVFGK